MLFPATLLFAMMSACGSGGGSTVTIVPTWLLTVASTTPSTGVAITVTPADNNGSANGTTSFTRLYNTGTAVTLTAPAMSGVNTFKSWSGCTAASTVTCNVTLTANTTVTANYTAPVTYTLTVNSTNPSSGVTIAVSPADNNNTSSGNTSLNLNYNTGTTVTLTAPATAGGNSLSSWTGCTVATNTTTCMVTMTANTTVTANYTGAVAGNTWYVSGTGSDTADGTSQATAFATLQHAANVTQPGDTVYVLNGTYSNLYNCCDVLDISTPGTANNWIAYKAYPGQTPIISFNGWEGIFFEPTSAYIEVSGFTIIGNNQNVTLAGAQAQSTSNPDPAYNGNCVAADGRAGTPTQRPHHIKILNNIISECGGGGIGSATADYLTISGNTIYNSAWYSIYGSSAISLYRSWDSDSNTGYKMYITGNTLYGNAELVPVGNSGQITDGEAIILDTNNNDYAGSTIPAYAGRTYIANNVIYGNGSSAIEVFDSQHADIVNNSTYGNVVGPALTGRGELFLNQAGDVNAINNIFYNGAGQNPAVIVGGTCPTCTLNYNLYYNGANNPTTFNGANDLTADPLYVDPADANPAMINLDVQPTSPAVGSGTSYLAPSTDINGKPRPGSKGYDRGAYQH
jgi:type IV secretory pathway protease TraF